MDSILYLSLYNKKINNILIIFILYCFLFLRVNDLLKKSVVLRVDFPN